MSQLGNLKQTIDGIAQQANQTAGSLDSFTQKFNQSIQQVQGTIGGSAQRKDQEVISSITNAQRKVKEAAEALKQAGKVAKSYGQSL